jgi:hypothetical protein
MEINGALNLSRGQRRIAASLPILSTPVVTWETHGASERPSGSRW